jgi:hypothetical protein
MFKGENIKVLGGLIVLLVVSRIIPHWPNVTALGAVTILAPRWFRDNKLVLIVPLLALLISDSIIGLHSTMIYTYLSVFLVSWLSLQTQRNSHSQMGEILSSGLTASMVFFLITNFGAWLALDMYQKSFSGLLLSYWNALPFFGYELFGNMFYLSVCIALRNVALKSKMVHS